MQQSDIDEESAYETKMVLVDSPQIIGEDDDNDEITITNGTTHGTVSQSPLMEDMELNQRPSFVNPQRSTIRYDCGTRGSVAHSMTSFDVDTHDTVSTSGILIDDNQQIMFNNQAMLLQDREDRKPFLPKKLPDKQSPQHPKATQVRKPTTTPQRSPVVKIEYGESSTSPGFQCPRCSKQFKTKSNLKQHQVLVHNQGSKFQCLTCNKYFPCDSHLRKHMLSHGISEITEDPNEGSTRSLSPVSVKVECSTSGLLCDRCERQFRTKSNLLQHQILVHNQTSPYQCLKCNKYFPCGSHLEKHMKSHEET